MKGFVLYHIIVLCIQPINVNFAGDSNSIGLSEFLINWLKQNLVFGNRIIKD